MEPSRHSRACFVWLVLAAACGSAPASPTAGQQQTTTTTTTQVPARAVYDVDALGVPKFVNVIYIDLTQRGADGQPLINQISKFRSSQGHDYSDSYESCRSMKHYFSVPDENTRIYSPVTGTVAQFDQGPGTPYTDRFVVIPDAQPAFTFIVFHPVLDRKFTQGEHVTEGQLIGHHVGSWTSSDIAVLVNDGLGVPKSTNYGPSGRLVSYFETLTDAAFGAFRARGIASPSDLVISKALRDANPARCNGEAFDPTWVDPLVGILHF
jgi:hypothetical protein